MEIDNNLKREEVGMLVKEPLILNSYFFFIYWFWLILVFYAINKIAKNNIFFLKRKYINKEKRIHTNISHFFIIFKIIIFLQKSFFIAM
jgi:hypothetical protein